jgi:hypothetical protein
MTPLDQRCLDYWQLGRRMKISFGAARLRVSMEMQAMLKHEMHPTLVRVMTRRLGYCERGGFVIEGPDVGGAA